MRSVAVVFHDLRTLCYIYIYIYIYIYEIAAPSRTKIWQHALLRFSMPSCVATRNTLSMTYPYGSGMLGTNGACHVARLHAIQLIPNLRQCLPICTSPSKSELFCDDVKETRTPKLLNHWVAPSVRSSTKYRGAHDNIYLGLLRDLR